eukprot:gene4746-5201_t
MSYASLYVSNLPTFCTEDDLVQVFAPFGNLLQVKIWQIDASSSALVNFSSFAEASQAQIQMNGHVLMGRKMRVELTNTRGGGGPSAINSIYVRYGTKNVIPITPKDLQAAFSPFGVVTEISIKDSTVDPRTGRQSGLAFVHYDSTPQGLQSALQAISVMDGMSVEGIHFKAEPSRNLIKQFNQDHQQMQQRQQQHKCDHQHFLNHTGHARSNIHQPNHVQNQNKYIHSESMPNQYPLLEGRRNLIQPSFAYPNISSLSIYAPACLEEQQYFQQQHQGYEFDGPFHASHSIGPIARPQSRPMGTAHSPSCGYSNSSVTSPSSISRSDSGSMFDMQSSIASSTCSWPSSIGYPSPLPNTSHGYQSFPVGENCGGFRMGEASWIVHA